MTATTLQTWVGVLGALLAAALGIFKYFNYRTRRDRVSVVGQAFASTVEGLSSDAEAKKLAAAILLRRFFDEETEQGTAGAPYEREAVAVIAALLRNTQTGELQKLLADGLAYAPSLQDADLQECNLSRAYLGERSRAAVTHGSMRLLRSNRRWIRQTTNSATGSARLGQRQPSSPVNLTKADLFHADLTGASLRGVVAPEAVFYTAIVQKTVFEEAHLEGADFREADLNGARFTGAWVEGARFAGAHSIPSNIKELLDADEQVPLGKGMPVPPIR